MNHASCFHLDVCSYQRNKNQTEDGWEFPRHRLHVISILGEGCFGQVWKCQAQNIAGESFSEKPGPIACRHASGVRYDCILSFTGLEGSSFVAVKTLKESAGDKERQDLLKELQVMKSLKPHPNIVTLFGCCTDKGIILSRSCIILPKLELRANKCTCNNNQGNCRASRRYRHKASKRF